MTAKIQLKLHSAQFGVWTSTTRNKVIVAGRRFGKTFLAVVSLVLTALSHKNAYLWYVSPSYRQSKTIAWRLLKYIVQLIGAEATYNESELKVTFTRTNAVIELKGADNEDSLRGVGLGCPGTKEVLGLVVDEFASIYNNWQVWNEVLRPMLSDYRAGVIFIGTPKGKDALFELFMLGKSQDTAWESWQFTSYDNPHIDHDDIDQAKKEMPERYFRQEYMASFEDFEGLIYPEFSEDLHVIEPYHIPSAYPRIGSIDVAVSGTTAVLKCAVDTEGILTFYEEYYEKNVRVSEVCESIVTEGEEIDWYIDPASKAKNTVREGNLYSLYDEYRDYGIVASPADNDVMAGINRVAEYFKTGKIRIFKTCTNLLWEIARYHWAEVKETASGLTIAKPYKKDDHLMDDFRYLIASRPMDADIRFKEHLHPVSPMAMARKQRKRNNEYSAR